MDFDEVEQAILDRVLAVDVTGHEQGRPGVRMREAPAPLAATSSSAALAHLACAVFTGSAPPRDGRQARSGGVDDAVYATRARVVVQVCYQLRPGRQSADARTAGSLAARVLRAVLRRPGSGELASGCSEWQASPVDALQQSVTNDQAFLIVSQSYDVMFEVKL